jgi:hypothetical protein
MRLSSIISLGMFSTVIAAELFAAECPNNMEKLAEVGGSTFCATCDSENHVTSWGPASNCNSITRHSDFNMLFCLNQGTGTVLIYDQALSADKRFLAACNGQFSISY